MQPLASLADGGRQTGFDVHVNIFQADRKIEFAGLDLSQDLLQAVDDLLHVLQRDDTLLAQHAGMGHGAANILMIEAFVEIDRCGEFFYELIGGLGKASAPEFVFGHGILFPYHWSGNPRWVTIREKRIKSKQRRILCSTLYNFPHPVRQLPDIVGPLGPATSEVRD